MNKIINILKRIEEARGSNEKKQILQNHMSPTVHKFFKLFYKDVNYNISKKSFEKIINYNKKEHGTYTDIGQLLYLNPIISNVNVNYTLDAVEEFLDKLETIRGNDALKMIETIYTSLSRDFQKWITRLIVGDLRIGMNLKTINKVFVQCDLKPIEKFGVQLCGSVKNIEDYDKGFPIIVGCKYDGMRCIVQKEGDKITMTSRQGKNIDYVPELIEVFEKLKDNFIIDGEIMCNNFSDLQKRIGRKADNIEPIENLHFRAYDIISFNNDNLAVKSQTARSKILRDIFFKKENTMLKLEEHKFVKNQEELGQFYYDMCDREEEGIVIKLVDKPYEVDSRKNWWKVKPKMSNTFKIIGFEYGTGKNKDKISVLKVEDLSKTITSNVGSGFTDDNREYLTNNKNILIGKLCDIEYNEITKNKVGKYSLRFPRFQKFRDDIGYADNIYYDI